MQNLGANKVHYGQLENRECTFKHDLLVDIVRTALLVLLQRFSLALAFFVNFDVIALS